MERNVIVGSWYVVQGPAGATVTVVGAVNPCCTVPEGGQGTFLATAPVVVVSDETVELHKTNFNSAPAKLMALGLLGGGATNALPAWYIPAEFLGNFNPNNWIKTDYIPNDETGAVAKIKKTTGPIAPNIIAGMRNDGGDTRWAMPTPDLVNYFGWGGLFSFSNLEHVGMAESRLNWLNSRIASLAVNGASEFRELDTLPFVPIGEMSIFGMRNVQGGINSWQGLFFFIKISQGQEVVRSFYPAVDKNGVPCMFDKVTKQPFYNSGTGSFIVGFTLAQARKLSKLPATGGSLTISLPSNWQEDAGVVNALATAEANGWVITYQTYEADASSTSTFALRRIFVRKTQNENGQYVDADGSRWHVEWCAGMIGAEPTEHGYEPFRSVDAAVAYWELTPGLPSSKKNF